MSAYPGQGGYSGGGRPRIAIKLVIALIIAGFVLVRYWSSIQPNAVTGHKQAIGWTVDQEIAMGLQSAPQMAAEFGGESSNPKMRAAVEAMGRRLVESLPAKARKRDGTPAYPFHYHVLADRQTINAFALPGGQVFITEALLSKLDTEGELAGVLGHETGHVLARHSSAQMENSKLLQGLVGAVTVAASDSRDHGRTAQMAGAMVANMLTLKYSRTDELEADALGLEFMTLAGYNPRSMIKVMDILEQASGGASAQRPEYSSTHPNPGHRRERIEEWLKEHYPQGLPKGLKD